MHSWIVLAVALSLTGCGLVGDGEITSDKDMPVDPPKGEDPPDPDAYQPAPAAPQLSVGAIDSIVAAVTERLNSVPYSHSVRVDDVTSGQVLFTSNEATPRIPASNTKLFTTAAAIDLLGPDHGLGVRAYGTGSVIGGVLGGDLIIVGEHDFTASSRMFPTARLPYDSLAAQLRAGGLTSVSGTVRVHGEFVFEGNSLGYLDVGAQRDVSRTQLGAALETAGISHGSIVDAGTLEPPPGATLLAEHTPVSLVASVGPINVPSHNEFADLLARHIGWRLAGTSSYGAGNSEMLQWMNAVGIATDGGAGFGDGSGLSRDNRVSANSVVDLFAYMRSTPSGERWRRSLATAGVRGTISGRMTGGDTLGRVLAKTGTLSNVIALSGSLHNRYDGHEYVFSILFNDVGSSSTARNVADQIVAAIARNHFELGGRLAAPDLARVRSVGAEGILDVAWLPVEGAAGYNVWFSDDGYSWDRARARYVESSTFVAGELAAAVPTFVRVTAVDGQGFESDPSVVLAATASGRLPTVLLVDANDRWREDPSSTNVPEFHHDFLAALGHSAAAMPFDSASDDAIRAGGVRLSDYDLVVYAFGEEGSTTTTLDADDQERLRTYVGDGGRVILSGSEILWDLVEQGDTTDRQFVADVLKVGFGGDDAETHLVATADSADPPVSFQDLDTMSIAYPDVLVPDSDVAVLFEYRLGTGGAAATMAGHDGGGKVVTMGFPLESIPSDTDRRATFETIYAAIMQ